MDIEYRQIAADLSELRAAEGDGMTLSGYAARFNAKSEDLGFRETIDPGAFDKTLKSRNDVKALVNHNSDMVIGSTRAGTLALEVRDGGLFDQIDLPDTTYGRDLSVSVGRGDTGGQSFGFSVVRDEWSSDYSQRRLLEVRLHEVSVVTFPAYRQTSVSVRAIARLAHRTDLDAEALADALESLSLGNDVTDDQAALVVAAVERLKPHTDDPEPDLTDVLAMKKYLLGKATAA